MTQRKFMLLLKRQHFSLSLFLCDGECAISNKTKKEVKSANPLIFNTEKYKKILGWQNYFGLLTLLKRADR